LQVKTARRKAAEREDESDGDDEGNDEEEAAGQPAEGDDATVAGQPAEGDDATNATDAVVVPEPPVTTVPPMGRSDSERGSEWRVCDSNPGSVSSCKLYDQLSLQWAAFRDEADQAREELHRREEEFRGLADTLNEQLGLLANVKGRYMEKLGEAVSGLNAYGSEMKQKEEEQRQLQEEYEERRRTARAKISEILYTDICAIIRVRNDLLVASSTSPPDAVVDCDVEDWQDGECSMECDDACPAGGALGSNVDPFKCGGVQTLTRRVVVSPNEYGVSCPALTAQRKCNQVRCPVDCVMSEWSGWSKCTRECEGGVQLQTRSILTKPRHGGKACDTVQEERPCNTDSCDRDCLLDRWSQWSSCSVACAGGVQRRERRVLEPIRGEGRCPKQTSRWRLRSRPCNVQSCEGDEVCVGKQDLVLAIDGSGSVGEEGFEIYKELAVNITARYQARYFGKDAAKVGLVLFGQGRVKLDGGITEANRVAGLTADLQAIQDHIGSLVWQRGFANMAQAFTLADRMLSEGGRREAQSAVLVISDGKLPFARAALQKAQELKDKNVRIFALSSNIGGQDLDVLKGLVREPTASDSSGMVLYDSLEKLDDNFDVYAQEVVTKLCSHAISPSVFARQADYYEYTLIFEGGLPDDSCGGRWMELGHVDALQECADMARASGMGNGFSFGVGRETMGSCSAGWLGISDIQGAADEDASLQVQDTQWTTFLESLGDPQCPGGTWLPNPYFDVYVLKPQL
jgi:hypothetical protein